MADSDNSRTLSPVTGGAFHSLLVASLPTCPSSSAAQNPPFDACKDDPAMDAWRVWWTTWGHSTESNQRQQQLERTLFSTNSLLQSDASSRERDYGEALEAEDCASKTAEEAAAAVWQAPAQSIAVVTAKLHAAGTRGQPSPTNQQEPWPQIRAVISDL
ncbi:hypothetical protein EDE05_1067 [Neorhizobium sp. R1-B]|uniref:hypothetical protein n=1 Tax=Neorhizobium sp. R1-B TaxID=2485162 RepID=UPI0010650BED|nr:hypothetical protein [Neorhizobium sp. R1-B]TDX83601.1 hypothetical protein EDE05_1067 [Neorhizobium sp. R1-B]